MLDGESAPKVSDTMENVSAPGFQIPWVQRLNRAWIAAGSGLSGCPQSTGVDEQTSKDLPGCRKKRIVDTTARMAETAIRKKSGLQSHLSFPVTAYTLNRAINLSSVQIRSNLKRMSRPHCDRYLSGNGDNTRVCGRDPRGGSASDKPLSGLRIGNEEINPHLQMDS